MYRDTEVVLARKEVVGLLAEVSLVLKLEGDGWCSDQPKTTDS